MEFLSDFLNSEAGLALKGVLLLAFVDFAFGIFAAFRDGTFRLDSVGAFIRKHLMGRVFPIGTALALGYWSGEMLLTIPGLAAAAIYVAETAGSIKTSLVPPGGDEVEVNEAVNPIPQD